MPDVSSQRSFKEIRSGFAAMNLSPPAMRLWSGAGLSEMARNGAEILGVI
jgi:hypothetical protein